MKKIFNVFLIASVIALGSTGVFAKKVKTEKVKTDDVKSETVNSEQGALIAKK